MRIEEKDNFKEPALQNEPELCLRRLNKGWTSSKTYELVSKSSPSLENGKNDGPKCPRPERTPQTRGLVSKISQSPEKGSNDGPK